MSLPYRKILCPVDFDDNSIAALQTAAELARHFDATVYVLHTVLMIMPATSMPVRRSLQGTGGDGAQQPRTTRAQASGGNQIRDHG